MNTYIIIYDHRYGTDAWLHQCEGEPDLDAIADGLHDWEPNRDEKLIWIAVFGDWEVTKKGDQS